MGAPMLAMGRGSSMVVVGGARGMLGGSGVVGCRDAVKERQQLGLAVQAISHPHR